MDSVILYMNVVFGGFLALGLVILYLWLRQKREDEAADAHDISAE